MTCLTADCGRRVRPGGWLYCRECFEALLYRRVPKPPTAAVPRPPAALTELELRWLHGDR